MPEVRAWTADRATQGHRYVPVVDTGALQSIVGTTVGDGLEQNSFVDGETALGRWDCSGFRGAAGESDLAMQDFPE